MLDENDARVEELLASQLERTYSWLLIRAQQWPWVIASQLFPSDWRRARHDSSRSRDAERKATDACAGRRDAFLRPFFSTRRFSASFVGREGGHNAARLRNPQKMLRPAPPLHAPVKTKPHASLPPRPAPHRTHFFNVRQFFAFAGRERSEVVGSGPARRTTCPLIGGARRTTAPPPPRAKIRPNLRNRKTWASWARA